MYDEFISNSPIDTENFAEKFALNIKSACVIAFLGDLGMGKTCFTRGLARGLGYSGDVTSPTFALVNEYRGGRLPLFHFDMYRINTLDDLYSTGYFDYFDEQGVFAIEWSENISFALNDDTVFVKIERIDDNKRKITVLDKAGVKL